MTCHRIDGSESSSHSMTRHSLYGRCINTKDTKDTKDLGGNVLKPAYSKPSRPAWATAADRDDTFSLASVLAT